MAVLPCWAKAYCAVYISGGSDENKHILQSLGKSVLSCHNPQSRQTIQRVIDWFAADKNHNLVYTYHNVKQNKDVYMVALRDADGTLIGYYEKHEYRSPETMKLYDME